MEKYQVIFVDYYNRETLYNEYFESERKAEDWVNDLKSYSDDYFEVNYYNPEDKLKYSGYRIEEIPSELNEEFYKMQKLAGLITEEEYKAKLWYKKLL
jgi:hypothetical protein